jgi:ketosteroid isomerase-like protein
VSRENVDVVRGAFEAIAAGGVEGILPSIHPEFEATTPPGLAAEPDTYRGAEGVRRYFDSFYEAMDRLEFDPERFIEVGELVVVPMTLRARGRTTGIETEQRLVQMWEIADGKAIRIRVFATLEEAMEAAREHG